jgi:hypothetical protein
LVDADPDAAATLLALERDASGASDYLPVATQLHVLADKR